MSSSPDLAAYIIRRSTGILGDFQMPTCARLIEIEGVTQGWTARIDYSVIMTIIRRYKEHVTFWNANRNVILSELETLSNSLARSGFYYPPEILVSYFESA